MFRNDDRFNTPFGPWVSGWLIHRVRSDGFGKLPFLNCLCYYRHIMLFVAQVRIHLPCNICLSTCECRSKNLLTFLLS